MEITGYFRNLKDANRAVEILKSAGFENAISDMNDHYIADMDVHIDLPGAENSVSLSSIIMQSGHDDADMSKKSLAAANPAVSGMSGMDEITDINNKVIVKTSQKNINKVKDIIENMGGTLDNPNERIPKGLENIDIKDINERNINLD